jgi:hypothetical protein
VTRRADSCTPNSNYMSHRVRRNWQAWEDIGLSGQVLRWIREGVTIPLLNNRPPTPFNQVVSLLDATPEQLTFVEAELARFVETGAWERTTRSKYVSRLFLVAKPCNNQWRFIVDLRHMNNFCVKKRLRMESMLGVRHLTRKGDYMFSFDLKDGFYALGIVPELRDFLTINVRGQLYRLARLPMGWSLSPYHFCAFTDTFVRHLRQPDPGGFTTDQGRPTQKDGKSRPSKRFLRHKRWRGARILPYIDDFLLFAATRDLALALRQRVDRLLTSLGLLRHPSKGFWEPTQYGHHRGIDIDTTTCYFFAPAARQQARQLLQRATRTSRWLHVKELQSFAGQGKYLILAIPAARFFMREVHSVLGDKWGGRVRLAPHLRRDLQWWTQVPSHANSKNIHRPVESACIHCDSSGYGWGAILNGGLEARGFWGPKDEHRYISWKELKAVRLAVLSFLPHLVGRNILLHQDNHAVCYVLAGLTSRSPEMINELRRL